MKQVIWFRGGLPGKARDFNWHNTIGVWSVVPLAIVVASGAVISYPWASNLVYRAVGEAPPAPAGRGAAAAPARARAEGAGREGARRERASEGGAPALPPSLNAAWTTALAHRPEWRTVTLRVPSGSAPTLPFTIDEGGPGQPQYRGTLTVDRASGAVATWEGFDANSRGRQLRSLLRFAHTGEVLGPAGPGSRGPGLPRRRRPRLHRLRPDLATLRRLARPSPPSARTAGGPVRCLSPRSFAVSSVKSTNTMKTRRTSRRPSPSAPSASRRWATVGVLAASAALAGRVSAASIQLPPEFRARGVEPLPAAWLRDERRDASDVTIGPAAARTDDQLPAVTRFDIPPGPLSVVIKAFEAVTGYTVTLADPALGEIASPGVAGVITVDKAIAAMLSGTGVSARESGVRQLALSLGGVIESLDVTATTRVASVRYARPVAETPQTIQVIPRQVMEAQGVTTLSEALRNVPGISLQAGEGGGASSTTGDMFNLRGFSANNSLFVDGVRDDGLIARDVFNLEQVEVFLGPTGTDVGRGNAAGYVNMTTKTPGVQTRYAGMATIGSADQRRVSIDLNQATPIGEPGSWLAGTALRLNALKQDSGVPGRDEVRLRSQAVAPSLALGLGTHTRISAGGQFTEQDNVPDYGIPGAAWLDAPLAPTTIRAAAPVDQSNYYGTPAADSDRVSQDSTFARVEHDLRPTVQVKHQFRHNKAHRAAVISAIQNPAAYNAATGQVTIVRQGNERENRITANQTSLSTIGRTGRASHALTGTLEFTRESQFAPTLAGLGTRGTTDIFRPDVNAPVTGLAVARTGAFSDGQADTVAVSVFDAIDIGPRLQVTGGLRVERYDASFLARDAAGVTTTDVERRRHARQRQDRRALQADRSGQRLRVVRDHQDAARHGQLHAVGTGQQPEQPEHRPADLAPISRPAASGTSTAAGCR